LAIVTTMKMLSAWLSVGLTLATVAAAIWLANYGRRLLTGLALDIIQIYAALRQAQFDVSYRKSKAELTYAEVRLEIQKERKQLLAQMEEL